VGPIETMKVSRCQPPKLVGDAVRRDNTPVFLRILTIIKLIIESMSRSTTTFDDMHILGCSFSFIFSRSVSSIMRMMSEFH
jgi:hypothetical protein